MSTETKNAKTIIELQKRTNFGVKACKDALIEAGWDMTEAMNALQKRSGKMPTEGHFIEEGAFGVYEDDNRFAVIQLGSQTDFVAKSPAFIAAANSIAEAYAKNPEIMTKEFKEGVVNSDFRMQLQPFSEVIVIGQAYTLEKSNGSVFYMNHNRGKNNIFSAVQINTQDPQVGEELAAQVMYAQPLCIKAEDLTTTMQEVAKGREVILLEQELYSTPGKKVKDYLKEHGNPSVTNILRIQMR